MKIKITSWNIEGRLSHSGAKRRGTPDKIFLAIKKLNADILVLLEAHSEATLDDITHAKQLAKLGYTIRSVPYQDDTYLRTDTYTDKLSLMLLSKLPIDKFEIIRLADIRNAFSAIIDIDKNSPKIRIIGLHLDDRQESTRLKQVADLSKIINQSQIPTMVLGDFNAMHGTDIWPATFLRSKPIAKITQSVSPIIASRAVEMASGSTLKLLESNTRLVDADSKHRPTTTPKFRGAEWLPSIRLIQIDHMYISPEIKISNFEISADGGSDHRAISTTINI
jgi:endonuclease/exonuclease/phosphatase family metal-dependent hydrolase